MDGSCRWYRKIGGLEHWFFNLVVSSCVLLLWYPLRQIPGIGTVLNILIVAFVIEVAHPQFPQFENQAFQIGGISWCANYCIGGGIYLIVSLGPGPRDGLMTGLQEYSNLPLAVVRTAIEISVVTLGWVLGGVVGTLLFLHLELVLLFRCMLFFPIIFFLIGPAR